MIACGLLKLFDGLVRILYYSVIVINEFVLFCATKVRKNETRLCAGGPMADCLG
jgi:hypothetical protein